MLARQQTLEASVAWSYEHLEPAEQLLARRLAILHSFGLETAEAVGSDASIDAYAVLDLLTRLVDKSMVQVEHANGEARYRFLETVRQYLQARAVSAGEMAALRQRHLLHFLELAEALEPRLALGDGPTCLARLQLEFRNLDDALAWAEASGASAEMLRLVTALSLFYELRGHLAHGGRWFDRALAAAPAQPSALRARALWGAAHVGFYGGNYAAAATRGADALAMGEAIADKWATARALNTLGVLQALSTPTRARDMLTRSIELGAAIDDQWAVADGWKMVTVAWYVQHADHDARPALAALYRIGDALGSRFFLAWHQSMVGYFARDRGDYDAARTAFTLSLEYCHYVGDPSTGGFSEAWSAALDADLGDVDKAKQRLQHLLATAAVSGSELAVPEALFALARILIAEGDSAQARRLLAPQVEAFRDARVASWAGQLYIALGAACRVCGDLPSALAALDEASALASSLANPLMDSLILFERAQLADMAGDNGQAEDLLHAALNIQASSGLRPSAIATLESLAAIAARADSSVEAVHVLAASESLRSSSGLVRGSAEANANSVLLADLRGGLGNVAFDAHWTSASKLGLVEVVEYVSRARGTRKRPTSGWPSLTPTELRVATLVAEGLTNPQIGARMLIARGTVKIHLAHIFDKLEVSTRAQLAAMVTTRGIALRKR